MGAIADSGRKPLISVCRSSVSSRGELVCARYATIVRAVCTYCPLRCAALRCTTRIEPRLGAVVGGTVAHIAPKEKEREIGRGGGREQQFAVARQCAVAREREAEGGLSRDSPVYYERETMRPTVTKKAASRHVDFLLIVGFIRLSDLISAIMLKEGIDRDAG